MPPHLPRRHLLLSGSTLVGITLTLAVAVVLAHVGFGASGILRSQVGGRLIAQTEEEVCAANGQACNPPQCCPGSFCSITTDGENSRICRDSTCTLDADCPGGGACVGGRCSTPVPRCGDGVCYSSNEVCASCPEDCGPCPPGCGNGTVDTGEECDQGSANGTATSCCSNTCTLQSAGTECRGRAGTCDSAEVCTGSSASCPVDSFRPSTTVCRASAGVCDNEEKCSGTAAACPTDAFLPVTTVCRASAGVCDAAETCNGTATTCPSDSFQSSTTVCRAASGDCDVAENCTGSSATCPSNGYAADGSSCRGGNCLAGACRSTQSGVCGDGTVDPEENCDDRNTYSGDCCSPSCQLESYTTVCRVRAGECDVAENCPGNAAACPTDGLATVGTACTQDGQRGTCNGTGTCQVGGGQIGGGTSVCGNGIREGTEQCDGNDLGGYTCLNQGFAGGTLHCAATCTFDTVACTTRTTTTGGGGDGAPPLPPPCTPGAACCQSAGLCDPVENWDNTCQCPSNEFLRDGMSCTTCGGICQNGICIGKREGGSCGDGAVDPGEQCDGGACCNGCLFVPSGRICRSVSTIGDLPEYCSGLSATCPEDRHSAPPPVCGNGILEDPEECDDGNTANGDGCSSVCHMEGQRTIACCSQHYSYDGVLQSVDVYPSSFFRKFVLGQDCRSGDAIFFLNKESTKTEEEEEAEAACSRLLLPHQAPSAEPPPPPSDNPFEVYPMVETTIDISEATVDLVPEDASIRGEGQQLPDDGAWAVGGEVGGGIVTGCGDGIVDDDEGCDDGNTVGGDGCSADCIIEAGSPPGCVTQDVLSIFQRIIRAGLDFIGVESDPPLCLGNTDDATGGGGDSCGDGTCAANPSENSFNCPTDCPPCGDGVCDVTINDEGDIDGETTASCPQDCPACNGDGVCDVDDGETYEYCSTDCSLVDNVCDAAEQQLSPNSEDYPGVCSVPEESEVVTECNDGADNDSDGLADIYDPQCWDCSYCYAFFEALSPQEQADILADGSPGGFNSFGISEAESEGSCSTVSAQLTSQPGTLDQHCLTPAQARSCGNRLCDPGLECIRDICRTIKSYLLQNNPGSPPTCVELTSPSFANRIGNHMTAADLETAAFEAFRADLEGEIREAIGAGVTGEQLSTILRQIELRPTFLTLREGDPCPFPHFDTENCRSVSTPFGRFTGEIHRIADLVAILQSPPVADLGLSTTILRSIMTKLWAWGDVKAYVTHLRFTTDEGPLFNPRTDTINHFIDSTSARVRQRCERFARKRVQCCNVVAPPNGQCQATRAGLTTYRPPLVVVTYPTPPKNPCTESGFSGKIYNDTGGLTCKDPSTNGYDNTCAAFRCIYLGNDTSDDWPRGNNQLGIPQKRLCSSLSVRNPRDGRIVYPPDYNSIRRGVNGAPVLDANNHTTLDFRALGNPNPHQKGQGGWGNLVFNNRYTDPSCRQRSGDPAGATPVTQICFPPRQR